MNHIMIFMRHIMIFKRFWWHFWTLMLLGAGGAAAFLNWNVFSFCFSMLLLMCAGGTFFIHSLFLFLVGSLGRLSNDVFTTLAFHTFAFDVFLVLIYTLTCCRFLRLPLSITNLQLIVSIFPLLGPLSSHSTCTVEPISPIFDSK